MCNRHVQQRSALDGNRSRPGLPLTLGPNQSPHHPNLQREIAPAGTCEGSLEKPLCVGWREYRRRQYMGTLLFL